MYVYHVSSSWGCIHRTLLQDLNFLFMLARVIKIVKVKLFKRQSSIFHLYLASPPPSFPVMHPSYPAIHPSSPVTIPHLQLYPHHPQSSIPHVSMCAWLVSISISFLLVWISIKAFKTSIPHPQSSIHHLQSSIPHLQLTLTIPSHPSLIFNFTLTISSHPSSIPHLHLYHHHHHHQSPIIHPHLHPCLHSHLRSLQSGPKGFRLSIDGQATHSSRWKCKAVSSEWEVPGWTSSYFDDSDWGGIVVSG
jgi:hypothetical protein